MGPNSYNRKEKVLEFIRKYPGSTTERISCAFGSDTSCTIGKLLSSGLLRYETGYLLRNSNTRRYYLK